MDDYLFDGMESPNPKPMRREKMGSVVGAADAPTIYTCGYQGRTIVEIKELIREYHIDDWIDIRSKPYSRDHQFSQRFFKPAIETCCKYHGVVSLGGLPGTWTQEGRAKSCKKVIANAKAGKVIMIMCMERNVNSCHRKDLAKIFVDGGCKVVNL